MKEESKVANRDWVNHQACSMLQYINVIANYRLMQVKSIAEWSAILYTFIKLPFVIKIFILSIFEWPFYTGFTVYSYM